MRRHVLDLQTFGELGHGSPFAIRKSSNLHHQHVLKRRHAVAMRHFLAEAQETTQLVAKEASVSKSVFEMLRDGMASLAREYITL